MHGLGGCVKKYFTQYTKQIAESKYCKTHSSEENHPQPIRPKILKYAIYPELLQT